MRQLQIPVEETLAHGLSSFSVDERLYAVPVVAVREINAHLDMTRVPRAPDFVRGIVNLRGQLVTVVDLGARLGLGPTEIGERSRLVVLKTNAELDELGAGAIGTADDKIGLLVDRIHDVVMPEADDLEPPPAHVAADIAPLVAGVCNREGRTLTVLEPKLLLDHTFDPARARGGLPTENGEIR